jgi:hypothetical protein
MGRPYGKIKRKRTRRVAPKKTGSDAFKVRFCGKDEAPLSMAEIQQGLLELVRKLRHHDALRVKRATLYVTFVDHDGKEVMPDATGEWEIRAYRSAADEFGL